MDRWVCYCTNFTRCSKRCLLSVIVITLFFIILGTSYFPWIFSTNIKVETSSSLCEINPELVHLYSEVNLANAKISDYHLNPTEKPDDLVLFIGNGYFGLPLDGDYPFHVKSGRSLSLNVPFYPIVRVKVPLSFFERTALHYTNGIAYIDRCYHSNIRVLYTYYAHRSLPSIMVQKITIKNVFSRSFTFTLERKEHSLWDSASKKIINLFNTEKNEKEEYLVITGKVRYSSNKMLIVSVVTNNIGHQIHIPAVNSLTLTIFTSISYSIIEGENVNSGSDVESEAISNLKTVLSVPYDQIEIDHIKVWNSLWNSGFSVSHSKVKDALNGDLINLTIYYVLSSTRSFYHEKTSSADMKNMVTNSLSYMEGCYGSNHHTLEAVNLWNKMNTMEDINKIVALWLLTLEKQGCHEAVKAGADCIIQAMILSFGSFRFNKNHLELNMHPNNLHRNYHFRRINYGNQTHINVTIEVDENDKAVLYVALDRSDKNYYACDGGCLDKPIQLSQGNIKLPVKLTKPFTSILYITSDKQHMEELRHTLHLKEIAEAPAQERSLIILHKHGHHFGGLPTFFWVSIGTLIVIFHLFLLKLFFNEYLNQEKYKQKTEGQYRFSAKYRVLQ